MEFPNNSERQLTELLIGRIQEHLKKEEGNQWTHYNQTYQIIYKTLRQIHCTRCGAGTFDIRSSDAAPGTPGAWRTS